MMVWTNIRIKHNNIFKKTSVLRFASLRHRVFALGVSARPIHEIQNNVKTYPKIGKEPILFGYFFSIGRPGTRTTTATGCSSFLIASSGFIFFKACARDSMKTQDSTAKNNVTGRDTANSSHGEMDGMKLTIVCCIGKAYI